LDSLATEPFSIFPSDNNSMTRNASGHTLSRSSNLIISFPDKRVLAGMVVFWTCKNKIGIGIRKGIISEIQIRNIAQKITTKKKHVSDQKSISPCVGLEL
jgi:hypothetical protein